VADRVIPQRELRNNVGRVLRAAEAGETFTITVRGRPVARLGPASSVDEPRVDVDRATIRRLLADPIDTDLAADLDAVEEPVDDPWPT
jgi:prevent-host-death family protein